MMAVTISTIRLLWLWSILFCATIAIPTTKAFVAKSPDEDDFYKPPSDFRSARLGAILRHRPVPNPVTLDNVNAIKIKAAFQILYRTQDSHGNPEATVVTVLVPHNAKPGHLFHYAWFSDSAFNECSPSVTLQTGTRSDNTYGQLQMIIPINALNQGWYVSIADDNGPQAAYNAGLQEAYASLDSLRAVKQSGNITGITSDPVITMYGYSGGSVAISFATELQPTYAPDVHIAGAALGGLIPDLLELWRTQDISWSSFMPPTLLGLAHEYANLSKWLDENLIPEKAAEFRLGEQQCFTANRMFENHDMGAYFKRGAMSLRNDTVPSSVLKWAGNMGLRGTPKVPWYLFESVGDDASPITLADHLVEKHCKNGANIYYERNNMNVTHAWEDILRTPGAFLWLIDRHNKKPVKLGCEIVETSPESSRALASGQLVKGLLGPLLALFGATVGPTPGMPGAPATESITHAYRVLGCTGGLHMSTRKEKFTIELK